MAESADPGEMAARAAVAMSLHGLEERVAALEEMVARPLISVEAGRWSDDDIAKFREEFEKTAGRPWERHEMRILSSPPPLTPDQVRCLLRECVTVVKPGETLVVRVGFDITPAQVRELQEAADGMCEYRGFPFKVLVFPGEELGIAEPEP